MSRKVLFLSALLTTMSMSTLWSSEELPGDGEITLSSSPVSSSSSSVSASKFAQLPFYQSLIAEHKPDANAQYSVLSTLRSRQLGGAFHKDAFNLFLTACATEDQRVGELGANKALSYFEERYNAAEAKFGDKATSLALGAAAALNVPGHLNLAFLMSLFDVALAVPSALKVDAMPFPVQSVAVGLAIAAAQAEELVCPQVKPETIRGMRGSTLDAMTGLWTSHIVALSEKTKSNVGLSVLALKRKPRIEMPDTTGASHLAYAKALLAIESEKGEDAAKSVVAISTHLSAPDQGIHTGRIALLNAVSQVETTTKIGGVTFPIMDIVLALSGDAVTSQNTKYSDVVSRDPIGIAQARASILTRQVEQVKSHLSLLVDAANEIGTKNAMATLESSLPVSSSSSLSIGDEKKSIDEE